VSSGQTCPCNAARRAEAMRKRGSAHSRGYGSDWRREAAAFLSLPQNKQCAVCGKPAKVVMHLISIRLRPDLRMDKRNWRPGCHSCNAKEAAYGYALSSLTDGRKP